MLKVILVSTIHREHGECDVHGLTAILRAIKPDVIFEELRPSDFDSYYREGTMRKLETAAISRYLTEGSAHQVPVDDYPDGYATPETYAKLQKLDELIEERSPEYGALRDRIDQRSYYEGFRYLHSEEGTLDQCQSEAIYERAVASINDQALQEVFAVWKCHVQHREKAMLEGIYQYCRSHSFEQAVFLVGGAHVKSLLKGIAEREIPEPGCVKWQVWGGMAR